MSDLAYYATLALLVAGANVTADDVAGWLLAAGRAAALGLCVLVALVIACHRDGRKP